MAAVKLAISKIRTDGGTQPRSALDMTIVEDYSEAMAAGAKFPPVDVFYDGADYWLADGFHRCRAAYIADFEEIAASVHQGTLQDAQWFSYAANKTNGIYRSSEDKQRAVQAALKHPKSARMSDRALAKHLGVDHTTVGLWRNKVCPTGGIHQLGKRTGLDGRSRNVAKSGKPKQSKRTLPPPPSRTSKSAVVETPAAPPALPSKPTPAAPKQVVIPPPKSIAACAPDSPPTESAETAEKRTAIKPNGLIGACRNVLAWTGIERELLDMDETDIEVIKETYELLNRIARQSTNNTGTSGATGQPR